MPAPRSTWFLTLPIALSVACDSANRIDATSTSVAQSTVTPFGLEGIERLVPVPHHRVAFVADGAAWILDARSTTPERVADAASTELAAARGPDGLLVSIDGVMHTQGDTPGRSQLDDAIPGAVAEMTGLRDQLWLRTAEGLFHWQEGWLREVRVKDLPLTGPFAAGPDQLWVTDDVGVHGLEATDEGWRVFASRALGRADALAFDATHTAWAVVQGTLWRHDGAWAAFEFGEPVLDVQGHPSADGVWVRTPGGALHVTGDVALRVESLPAIDESAVDEAGRWLVRSGTTVSLVSPRPMLVPIGLEEGDTLTGPRTLSLTATSPDAVTEVRAWLDDDEVLVDLAGWTLTLDPAAMPEGDHTVRATVSWSDGGTADTRTLGFHTGATSEVTWQDQIEPLQQRRCAVCHHGGTVTLLDTRQAWIDQVDDVLREVEAGRMPLGGASLTDAEIGLIRRWKDGGFP